MSMSPPSLQPCRGVKTPDQRIIMLFTVRIKVKYKYLTIYLVYESFEKAILRDLIDRTQPRERSSCLSFYGF